MKTTYPHKIRWIVNEGFQGVLPSHTLNQVINLEGIREHKMVRTLPSRTVRYLKPSSPEIPALYLKEYHLPNFLDGIKNLFLSPAEREWYIAHKITKKDVPTFTPLAVGKIRRFGLLKKNYLISKSIDGAKPLKEYMPDDYPNQAGSNVTDKISAIESLAQFVKNLHQKGIFHQDFHSGNILIGKDDKGNIHFYLMDLHRVKLQSKLSDRQRVQNLASLNTGFYQTTRKTEKLRFLKTYLNGDRRWEANYPHFTRLIEATTDKMMKKMWHKRDKRCLKSNKYFVPFKSDTFKGFINRDFYSPELLDLLHNPDRSFTESLSTVIKDSNTTSSCFMPLEIAGKTVELHIKRFNYQNIPYTLKNLFRTSRGKRVWKVAHGLLLRNIPTPLPVAFLEQRKGRLLIKSFFITKKIDQSLPLISLFQKGTVNSPDEISKIRNEILQQGACILRRMHERGVCHGDLKASNILVQKKAGQKEKLYLADLDSARVKKSVKEEDKIRDLARLNASLLDTRAVSTPERLRLLQYYLRQTGDQKVQEYWKTILERTQNKLKKTGRKFI